MLTAVPHPHAETGYKDPRDPCNRTDKRNGGQYRRFERHVRRVCEILRAAWTTMHHLRCAPAACRLDCCSSTKASSQQLQCMRDAAVLLQHTAFITGRPSCRLQSFKLSKHCTLSDLCQPAATSFLSHWCRCVCCCSSYSKHYASIDDKPIQFREDGLPISARMVPGKPLMVSGTG
jgi:hypothetical protein